MRVSIWEIKEVSESELGVGGGGEGEGSEWVKPGGMGRARRDFALVGAV